MTASTLTINIDSLLKNFNSAIFVLDQQQRIVSWNNRMSHFSGISEENTLNQTFSDIFADMTNSRIHQAIISNLASGMPAAISNILNKSPFPLYIQNSKKNERIAQSITITRIQPSADSFCCLIEITDVTPAWAREQALEKQVIERKRAEQTLLAKSQQLQSALDAAHAGIFHFDVSTKNVQWDDKSCVIIGDKEAIRKNSYDNWILHIHPLDRNDFDRHFMSNIKDKTIINIDLEYRQNDMKDEKWIAIKAIIDRNDNDEAIAISGMIQDITVYWQQLSLLQERTSAEFANKAKSLFLANMSHQLRTPLHGILGYAQLGVKKAIASEQDKLKDYCTHIQTSGSMLLILLDELIELSELEDGEMKLMIDPHDFPETIEACINNLSTRILEKSLNIHFENELSNNETYFDRLKISRVITHCLENAIKFSNSNKTIAITLKNKLLNKKNQVSILIEDQGIGIPTDELDSIFENFKVSSRTQDGAGDRGIGLAFCRGVISSHNGQIWAENNSYGGTDINILMPLK